MDLKDIINHAPASSTAQNTNKSSLNPVSPIQNGFAESNSIHPITPVDQSNQSTTDDLVMTEASNLPPPQEIQTTTGRRTRGSKKPTNIRTENGNAALKLQPPQQSPHAPKQSSKLSNPPQNVDQEIITTLHPYKLDKDEYFIPLSVPLRLYEQYTETIRKYKQQQKHFISGKPPSIKEITEMSKIVIELNQIVNHPDMVDKAAMEVPADPENGEVSYGRTASYKFTLLYGLLKAVSEDLSKGLGGSLLAATRDPTSFRMAIMVEDGTLASILTRFLDEMQIAFKMVDEEKPYNQEHKNQLDLIVIPSSFKDVNKLAPVDLVFALDASFSRDSEVMKALKGHDNKKTRVLIPMVYSSPEHIRTCLPAADTELNSLRLFVQIIFQLYRELGFISNHSKSSTIENGRGPHSHIRELSQWILSGFTTTAPKSNIPALKLRGMEFLFKSPNKRALDDSDDQEPDSPSKRQRTEEDTPNDDEVLSDVPPSDQIIAALREEVKSLKKTVRKQEAKIMTHDTAIWKSETTLETIHAELKTSRQEKIDLEDKLRAEIQTSNGLMNACDKAINQLNEARVRNQNHLQEGRKLQATIDAQSTAIEKLRAKITDLEDKAKEKTIAATQSSSNDPDGTSESNDAEILRMRSENQANQEQIASLKRKAQSAEENRAYAFHLYQEASSRAVELTGEVQEKQNEIDRLIPLAENASGLAYQAADASEFEATQAALQRVISEKEELEEQLRRGNTRPGMSTRGQSSAPGTSRSPRVATSPPPRSRASSRQPGSRASSPTGRNAGGGRRALPGRFTET